MTLGVMITHGGAHPPDKWADTIASQITDVIVIEPTSIMLASATEAKENLRIALITELSKQVDLVQTSYTNFSEVDRAMKAVIEVTDKSPFAEHFRKPEVIKFVRETLMRHLSSVAYIEQSYADKSGV
jgi:hypothetical protein